MASKRIPLKFGFNSLSIRLSLLISIICLLAGAAAATLMLKAEHKQLSHEENDALGASAERIITQFNHLIDTKKNVAVSAARVIESQLFGETTLVAGPSQLAFDYEYDYAKSIEPNSESRALFKAQSVSLEQQQLAAKSASLWHVLSPPLLREFHSIYFVSTDGFVRMAPGKYIDDANAQSVKALLQKVATANTLNNPTLNPVWTRAYYDTIWQKWVVSLLVPIYRDNAFLGVAGFDLDLAKLVAQVPVGDSEQKLFIFDEQTNVLTHPAITTGTRAKQMRAGQLFKAKDIVTNELNLIVNDAIRLALPQMVSSYTDVDKFHIVNIRKVDTLNWYVGIYKPRSAAIAAVDELKIKFFGLFILYAILVALLLHQVLYQLVLKRILMIVHAVTDFGKGELNAALPPPSKDEIGALNSACGEMMTEIGELIDGLNQRIVEKEQAEKAAKRLSKAVSFSGSAIVIANESLQIEYVNPKMLEMTGIEEGQFIKSSLSFIFADDMSLLVDDIELDLRNRHYWRGDTMLRSVHHKPTWVSLSISPIREESGKISSYVASAQDITFVKESQRKMEQLAYFDTLTGLANRTFFRMQLRKSMSLAERGHYSFALFYFDLDEFKRINDTLGHDSGDQLLVEVANRLKLRLRAEDTIARLGGDEFAVLLSGIDDKDRAADVALTIQETLCRPIRLGSNEVIISASIGITMAPQDSQEEDQLLKHADLAMYEAKAKGRNTYHFYSKELHAAARERLHIENELRHAIKEEQFSLHYQPQVDSRTNRVVGYEALVRWQHPVEGMIPPPKFIPIAEATGMIVEIGEWVLEEACHFASRMDALGHGSNISINLSARQFKDSNLRQVLQRILNKTKIKASSLHLELTESMLMGDVDAAINQLYEMKKLGVSISIDDFGTGYSSLSYLKRFPVDILKVDRSFVKDIPGDRNDMEITAAIIAMAQKLNLNVVAEGVESKEQVAFLEENNCHIVQGYYYSKPMPESELLGSLTSESELEKA